MLKQLFGNRVAIRPIIDEEDKTSGGILIPGKKGQKKLIGEVVAIGKGLLLHDGTRAEMDIKKGMKVIYKQYAGTIVDDNGDSLIILQEPDIIAEVE